MKSMVNYTNRGGGLLLFLVALAVLTGCQPGPTKVQEAHNIEEPRQNAEQVDTAEVSSPPAKPGSTAACCKCDDDKQKILNKCEDVEPLDLVPCCKCEDVGPSEEVICLSVKQMRDHVDHIEPIKPPGLLNGRLRGIVRLAILFDSTGSVSYIGLKCGSPLVLGNAVEAVRKWTFKPVVVNGVKKAGCGIIRIKYRLAYPDPLNKNFTELQ